jgi:hypothetical protein
MDNRSKTLWWDICESWQSEYIKTATFCLVMWVAKRDIFDSTASCLTREANSYWESLLDIVFTNASAPNLRYMLITYEVHISTHY